MSLEIVKKVYNRVNVLNYASTLIEPACNPMDFKKIHFACGYDILPGWLNIDLKPVYWFPKEKRKQYMRINLCEPYPFPDNHFQFGYSQDFLEHLPQADSITYLSEAYRVLAPGGVLRTSTPGLKGVLKAHYRKSDYAGSLQGKVEAYTSWDHVHFYSEESIATVAKHVGFKKVEIKPANESDFSELRALDTRLDQAGLNLIVEMTK